MYIQDSMQTWTQQQILNEKRICQLVVGFHVVLLLVFVCMELLVSIKNKPLDVFEVSLLNLPPQPVPAPAQQQSEQPAPQPAQSEISEPQPPAPAQPPELAVSRTPAKPKWKPRSIEDIRKEGLKASPQPTPQPVDNTAEKIRKIQEKLAANQQTTVSRPSPAASKNYASVVYSILYRSWQQPALSSSDVTNPVRILITIAPNGKLVTYKIKQRSGVSLMDASVVRALNATKTFPAPSRYGLGNANYEVEITFRLN